MRTQRSDLSKLKKNRIVLFALMLLLVITSCGNNGHTNSPETILENTDATATEPLATPLTSTIVYPTTDTSSVETTTNTTSPSKEPTTTIAETTQKALSQITAPSAEQSIQPTQAPVRPTAAQHTAGTYVICIDPGHQEKGISGTEPVAPGSTVMKAKVSSGTRGTTTGVPEYQLVLTLGLQLKDLLEAAGVTVVMTRETHDVSTSNIERAEMANAAGADLFVRIHADGSEKSSVSGISMLIPGDVYLKDEVQLTKSKTAGKAILSEVIAATGAKNRGLIERSDMTGFNWSLVPVVLIETGFMTNPDEDLLLNTADYQEKLVNGLYNGIMNWLSEQ